MLEIFDYPLAAAFERDAENALTAFHLIRMMSSHVSKKRVNSGKPDITCGHTVLAVLLEVVEKSQNLVRFKILQIQVRYLALSSGSKKPEQKYEAVSIAENRVGTHAAKPWQMIGKVIPQATSEEIG